MSSSIPAPDTGEPVYVFTAQGVLMMSAIEAYEEGNLKAEVIVDQTLALAAEHGYRQGYEFRAAFYRVPADPQECKRQVDAVFALLGPDEFMRKIMQPAFAAAQIHGGFRHV